MEAHQPDGQSRQEEETGGDEEQDIGQGAEFAEAVDPCFQIHDVFHADVLEKPEIVHQHRHGGDHQNRDHEFQPIRFFVRVCHIPSPVMISRFF
jgi:hypothetical protein